MYDHAKWLSEHAILPVKKLMLLLLLLRGLIVVVVVFIRVIVSKDGGLCSVTSG